MTLSQDPDKSVRAALLTAKRALPGAEVATAYHPTLRDRAAMALLQGSSPNSTWGHVVGGLMGSYGVGKTGQFNLADFMPWFQADEGGRDIAEGHPIRGAANVVMALPIPGAKAVEVAKNVAARAGEKAAAQAAERAAPKIVAYHGSPYSFDKFDAAKIGTGEGAQVYGHGLYFAENEKVAQGYRKKLAGGQSLPPDVLSEYYTPGRVVQGYGGPDKVVGFNPGPQEEPWNWSVNVISSSPDGTPLRGEYVRTHRTEPSRAAVEQALGRKLPDPGATYQVGIHAEPEHFIDWDRPLSEQHPVVQAALGDSAQETAASKLGRAYRNPLFAGAIVGRDTATPEELSAHLASKGVPGIRYLDQGSRATGEGTRNYVVFDPNHIDILKRYGIPATVFGGAGGGLAASAAGDKPEAADASAPAPDLKRGGKVRSRPAKPDRSLIDRALAVARKSASHT